VLAEDLVFSGMGYELLLAAACGEGISVGEMSVSCASAAFDLAHMRLVMEKGGRLVTTARGELVSLAETETVLGTGDIRVRAGSLWAKELAGQWAALELSHGSSRFDLK
jgi:hypothetical protein